MNCKNITNQTINIRVKKDFLTVQPNEVVELPVLYDGFEEVQICEPQPDDLVVEPLVSVIKKTKPAKPKKK